MFLEETTLPSLTLGLSFQVLYTCSTEPFYVSWRDKAAFAYAWLVSPSTLHIHQCLLHEVPSLTELFDKLILGPKPLDLLRIGNNGQYQYPVVADDDDDDDDDDDEDDKKYR